MAFTKVVGAGIHTLAQLQTHNIHSAGIITATTFVGNIGGNPTFTGDATFNGNVSIGGTLTYEDVKNVDSVGLGTFREGIFVPDNKTIHLGGTNANPDFIIHTSSTYEQGIIDYKRSGTGRAFRIRSTNTQIENWNGLTPIAKFIGGVGVGHVELNYAGSKKFETTSSGVSIGGTTIITSASGGKVGIGTDNPTAPLQINHVSPKIILEDDDNAADVSIANIGGAAVYSSNSDVIFQTADTSEKFRIVANGAVGIGTHTPIGDFTVKTNGMGYFGIDGGGGNGAEFNVYHGTTKANTYKFANNGGSNELAQYTLYNAGGKHIWNIGGGTAEKMRLTTTGLGIGTDTPLQRLHVKQGSTTTPAMVEALGAKSHVKFQHNAGSSYTTTIGSKTLGAGNVGLTFDTGTSGGGTKMTIDVNGKVGGGTELPQTMHHLYGSSGLYTRFESAQGQVNFGNSNGAGVIHVTSTSQPLRFLVNGSNERARIASDGKFGIGDFSSGSVAQALHVKGSDTKIYLEHVGGYDMTISTNTGGGQCGINVSGGYLDLCSNNRDLVECLFGGSVGIGSATPAQKLNVVGNVQIGSPVNTARNLIFSADRPANADLGNIIAKNTGGNIAAIKFHSGEDGTNKDDGQITFHTSPHSGQQLHEHLRINESGNILMGITDSHGTVLASYSPKMQIESTSVHGASIFLNRDGNDSGGPFLFLGHGRGGNGLVQENDELGRISFVGGTGSGFKAAAEIIALVDGTPGSGSDMPGRLVFKITGDNQGSPYEKMRITQEGQVVIGHNGVGVGTAMADDLTIATGNHTGITIRSGTSHYGSIYFADGVPDGTDVDQRGVIRYQHSDDDFVFCTNGNTPRVRISHNVVSLGSHAQKTFSLGNVVNVGAQENNLWGESGDGFHMMQNAYYNGGYKHVSNDMSTLYTQYQGHHVWYTAAAASAASTVDWKTRLRINQHGRLKINHNNSAGQLDDTWLSIYDANSDSSAHDPTGISKNYAMIALHNYGTGSPGDTAGIGFGAGAAFTYTKGSVAFQRTTSYGRGDLVFFSNDDGDSTLVNENDERMRITRGGKISMGGEANPIALLTLNKGSVGSNNTYSTGEILRLEGYDSTNSKHGIGFGRYGGGANGYKPAAFIGAKEGIWSNYTNCHLTFATRISTSDDEPTERLRIKNDGDLVLRGNDKGWSTIQYAYNGRGVKRHFREYNTGSSAITYNLIRIRRHYWGWGHYKITVKRVYYSGIGDSVFYINGHGRTDGSYNASYAVLEKKHNNHTSNTHSSARISITSPSTSSPGDIYAAYIDVQLNCPAYMYLFVEVEAAASNEDADISSLGSDQYALHP